MKILSLLALLVAYGSFSNYGYSQPPRTSGPPIIRGPAPAQKVKLVPANDALNDFAKKGLPRTYTFGGDLNAELARKAAEVILTGEQDSLSALIGALQLAGFHIIDEKQKILFQPSQPNGTAFFDYEVAGMLRAGNMGFVTSLERIGTVIKGQSAALKNIDFGAKMLADIRTNRTSKDPQTQFLAELIFALGKGTSDLSTPQSNITMAQASLIERRFLGDLVTAFEKASGGIARYSTNNGVSFINASFSAAPYAVFDESPCPTIDIAAQAQGYNKKGKKIIKFFGFLPEDAGSGGILKDAANGVELANNIMAYLKLIAANLFIEIEVDVPNPPIPRTKSNQYVDRGDERTITATFKRYFPNSAQINCVAKVIKMVTNAELDVPEEGLLKDVPVKWEPLDRAEVSPLYIDAIDRGNVYTQRTNESGQNQIKATGKEQRRDLRKIAVTPVSKYDRWRLSIATEKMDAKSDIPKILWGALDLKKGSILTYFISFIPDMLGKMALKSQQVNIPVRDWEPCTEDWAGTISYTRDLRKTEVITSRLKLGFNSGGDGTRTTDIHEDVQITLNPRTREEIAANVPKKRAQFDAYGNYTTRFEGFRANDPCCGKEEGKYTTRFVSGTDIDFSGQFAYSFGMTFKGGDNDYQLGFSLDTGPIKSRVHDYEHVEESNCFLETGHDETMENTAWVHATLASGRYPSMYLTDGVELVGGKKLQEADGSTVTWWWELSRCKPAGR